MLRTALKEPKLVRLVRRLKRVLERVRFPFRRSRFANHLFDDHQHLILLALRSYEGLSYRRFVELLAVATQIWDVLGLRRAPHFTTLQKFAARQDVARLEEILVGFLVEFRVRVLYLAVDSTGYQASRQSSHYSWVLVNHHGRDRRRAQRPLKATFAVDCKRRIVVMVRLRWGPGPDYQDLVPLLSKLHRYGVRVKWVVADKGYDSEAIREFIVRGLGAEPHIPIRRSAFGGHLRGRWRKRQRRRFSPNVYRQRVQVESVFSAAKRLEGDSLAGRRVLSRRRELLFRAIAFDAHRAATVLGDVANQGFY